jgi:hypothetical protein
MCTFNSCLQAHQQLQEALQMAAVMQTAVGRYQSELQLNSAVRDNLTAADEDHVVAATLQHLVAQ